MWTNEREELSIWGFTPLSAAMSLSIRTFDAGQLIASFQYGDEAFTALITESRGEFIDPSRYSLRHTLVHRITHSSLDNLELDSAFSRSSDIATIARFMRSHHHGGTLLVVPNNDAWIDSAHQPIVLEGPSYEKVKNDLQYRDGAFEEERKNEPWPFLSDRYRAVAESAERSVKLIGQFTAIDGATLVRYDLTVLAFGVKLKPINAQERPERVLTSEPFEGSSEIETDLSELGGTRHQSAAQFVFDQKDSVAIVASQDGTMSILAWEPERKMVRVTRHAEFGFL